MKIALVTDFLLYRRGAERVFEILAEMFPDADIFTLLHNPDQVPLNGRKITTSYLQRIPGIVNFQKNIYPIYPSAIEAINLKGYDLVISTTAMWAHGVICHPDTLHISYMHSPLRYAWYLFPEFAAVQFNKNWIRAVLDTFILSQIRVWDSTAVRRIPFLIANSNNTKNKIFAYYGLDSQVIYPPIDIEKYVVSTEHQGYYLFVGELLPYKGVNLLVDAFCKSDKRLVVIGKGSEYEKLHGKAKGSKNIKILGWQEDHIVKSYMSNCRAVIIPGEEDFGLVSLEAQAYGKPVVAYGKGGSLETIKAGESGRFFYEQTPSALMAAIEALEKDSFDPLHVRGMASRFDRSVFVEKWQHLIKLVLEGKYENLGVNS